MKPIQVYDGDGVKPRENDRKAKLDQVSKEIFIKTLKGDLPPSFVQPLYDNGYLAGMNETQAKALASQIGYKAPQMTGAEIAAMIEDMEAEDAKALAKKAGL